MQYKSQLTRYKSLGLKLTVALTLTVLTLVGSSQTVLAHHPTGGKTPSNVFEALLSGFGHPIIGLDHLAFVIASGLLATQLRRGWIIPVGFVLTAMLGTGLHLQAVTLPMAELSIALSVIVAGGLIASESQSQSSDSSFSQSFGLTLAVAIAAAVAGLFHGYAYGEAIIGAEMGPMLAYLTGFTFIQLVIAAGTYALVQVTLFSSQYRRAILRALGLAISSFGLVVLGTGLFS
jgi:urease accessory protein